MDLHTLRLFFMWCVIINGGLFLFWSIWVFCVPELVYRIQRAFVPISRETFDVAIYCFLGLFKILFLMFNLIPFIVLTILA